MPQIRQRPHLLRDLLRPAALAMVVGAILAPGGAADAADAADAVDAVDAVDAAEVQVDTAAITTTPLAPLPVSPGEADGMEALAPACPTFSWAPSAPGSHQRLLVFRADLDADLPRRPVVRHPVPPGASSWTPPGGACLEPGAAYAWSVGAADREGRWRFSEPFFFRVAGGSNPNATDSAAVGAVPSARDSSGRPRIGSVPSAGSQTGSSASAPAAFASGPPVLGPDLGSASAAVRGEQGDASGETAGLVGTVASPDGAGMIAGNLAVAGGADLVLDGAAQGLVDALLTESGIDRPSSDDQSFDIRNSGSGGMSLLVEGAALLSAPVEVGEIAPGAVGSDEVADGALTAGDLDPAAGLADGQVADDLTLSGGSVDATPVGASTPSTGAFTDLSATGQVALGDGTSPLVISASNLLLDALGELTVTAAITSSGPLDLTPATGLDINIGAASSFDVFVDGTRELQISSGGNINTGPNSAGRRNLRVSRVENDGSGLDLVLQAAGAGVVHLNDTLRLDAGETIANSGSVISFTGGSSELSLDLGSASPELASPTGEVVVADTLVVDEALRLAPIDSDAGGVSPTCDAAAVGTLYYDADEGSLCLCADGGGGAGFVALPAGGACD